MAFKPTEEQLKAIKARGSLLVSAAAGSGKTAVLSSRVIDRVFDEKDPVDIDRMLIVTFTNAAAAEMRERISDKFSRVIADQPDNLRAVRQRLMLDTAPICTIDSFCIDLVRENFEQLGISADFRIAGTEQLAVLSADAMSETISGFFERDDDEFKALLEIVGADYGDDKLAVAVRNIYEYTRSLPFPEKWMQSALEPYRHPEEFPHSEWFNIIIRDAFDCIDLAASRLERVHSEIAEYGDLCEKFEPVVSRALESAAILRALLRAEKWDEAYDFSSSFSGERMPTIRKCEFPQEKERIAGAVKAVYSAVYRVKRSLRGHVCDCENDIRMTAPHVKKLFEVVSAYAGRLDELKSERGIMDFADVEYAALRLLVTEQEGELVATDAAKEICGRFDEILVDEYQDTNDLQNAIFSALSDGGKKLFLVGDVKQSIYRFRQANPHNFIAKKESFPVYDGVSDPSKVILTGNFRSRKGICQFVNFVFHCIMSKSSADMDYLKEDELRSVGSFPESEHPQVELHILQNGDGEKADNEAEYIAKYISETVNSGVPSVSDGDGLRPAKYSDFILLLRSCNAKSQPYVSAFRRAGIPCWTETSGGFFERSEIMMMLSVLRAIDNPMRDVPLLGAMLSPIFGFSPDDISSIRLCDRKGTLYSALLCSSKENKKSAAFLKRLTAYRNLSSTLPSDLLIRRIYDDTAVLPIVGAMEDGAAKRANLLLLCEYAADFENQGYKGLSAFLRYVDIMQANKTGLAKASVTDSDNVVRIMSIHKSKGLEAPFCIVAALSSKFNKSDVNAGLVMNGDYGIGLRVCDDKRGVKLDTLPRMAIALRENHDTVAEEMRLLYVAVTRAKERLVLVSTEKDRDKALLSAAAGLDGGWGSASDPVDPSVVSGSSSMAQWIYMCALLHPDSVVLRDKYCPELNPVPESGHLAVFMDQADFDNKQDSVQRNAESDGYAGVVDISERLGYQYPHAALSSIKSKYSASELSERSSAAEYYCTARPAFMSKGELTPAQRGTATHEFMQFADYSAAKSDLDAEIERLCNEGFLMPVQADAIDRESVRGFFASNLFERIERADRVLREARFITEVPVSDIDSSVSEKNESAVVQGVADCVFFENGGIVILDFKTDRIKSPDELASRYYIQLKIYADALGRTYERPVRQCLIYSLFLNREIDLNIQT